MVSSLPLKAHLAIEDVEGPEQTAGLKRLALLFDEIRVIPVGFATLKESVLHDPERMQSRADGGKNVINFDFIRDTERVAAKGFESFRDHELREVIAALQGTGILEVTSSSEAYGEVDAQKIRDLVLEVDSKDARFIALSETPAEAFRLPKQVVTLKLSRNSDGQPLTLHHIPTPQAIDDSHTIISTLLLSEAQNSLPVFPRPRHRRELEYRYEQFKAGVQLLHDKYPNVVCDVDLRCGIGEVAFSVSNEIFDSRALASLSIEDVIRYREEMSEARRRYVAEDLVGLALLLKENPWSEATRAEVSKYVLGKVQKDIDEYELRSRSTYRKLFGHFVRHGASAVVGGGVGSLVGSVIPQASPLSLLLVGALVGAAREVPDLVKTVTDLLAEKASNRASSIAYVVSVNRRLSQRERNERKRERRRLRG